MTGGTKSEGDSGLLSHIPGQIRPTAHRNWWIFVGLVFQLVGIGGPAGYVWSKAKHQDVGGLVTVATVKAWLFVGHDFDPSLGEEAHFT